MSELTGVIVFEVKQPDIQKCLSQFTGETPVAVAQALLKAAGLEASQERFPAFFDLKDGVLFTEATERNPPWFIIEPFGEEWLGFLQVLAQSNSLHFWARLWHECGVDYYIANSSSGSLFQAVDNEDGDLEEDEIEQIEENWSTLLPQAVRPYFEED